MHVLFLRQLVFVRCRALLVDRQFYRHVCTSLRPPASVNDVPLLVPVGEALDAYIPDLETLTRREAEEQAMHEKELVPHLAQPRDIILPLSLPALTRGSTQGNEAFVNAQYLVALVHYSRAIKLFPEYSTCACSVSLLFVVISLISPHSVCYRDATEKRCSFPTGPWCISS